MTALTQLAHWPAIDDTSPDPRAFIVAAFSDKHIKDYDVDGLLGDWLDELNEDITEAEGVDEDVTLYPNGDLVGPAELTDEQKALALQTAQEAVKENVDLFVIAQSHDLHAGPYFIECSDHPEASVVRPIVYAYDTSKPLTCHQAALDARKRFAKENGLDELTVYTKSLAGPEEVGPETPLVVAQSGGNTHNPAITVPRGFAPVIPATNGGTTILSINAMDLIHRTAINSNGAEFHIDRLEFDARAGNITIWMTELDEDGDLTDNEVGVASLSGWAIL